MPRLVALLLLFVIAPVAAAQPERYELGQRLRAFEDAWEVHTDAAGRKRAVEPLQGVMQAFFSFQLGKAGQILDDSRHALMSAEKPSAAMRWADALYAQPETRLLDATAADLRVTVKPFYKVEGDAPANVQFRLKLGGEPVAADLKKLPAEVVVPVGKAAGDLKLMTETLVDGKVIGTRSIGISRVENLAKRLDALKTTAAGLPRPPATIEQATLRNTVDLLDSLADKKAFETNYPAAELIARCEQLTANKGPYFDHAKPGQFWLGVPARNGRTAGVRLFVPEKLDPKKPVPLVVALHGAGGTENLFFEGYGAGHIVKLCRERGWLLVATNSGTAGFLGGVPPVADVIDALADRYPVDKAKVFLIGHSMGAAQTVAIAQQTPERFAAAVALGGGGQVKKDAGNRIKNLPFFVGVGTKDFALTGARRLHQALRDAGVRDATLKEYPDVEHMVIVREALADVFAVYDRIARKTDKE
jgi:predicted esterase